MSHGVRPTGIEIKKALNSSRKTALRRGEMMQVVSNLIMNSVYAMQAGGVLSISVEDAVGFPDCIVLTIQDDGVGIADADLPRVFEAFFTTRNTVGTGIVLFVAKQFVEGHGGEIQIESRQNEEDHGTTVRVFLPISTTYDSSVEGVRAMGNEMQKIIPLLLLRLDARYLLCVRSRRTYGQRTLRSRPLVAAEQARDVRNTGQSYDHNEHDDDRHTLPQRRL